MDCSPSTTLSRRRLLQGTASLALWATLPVTAIAGTRDPRLLVIVLRGAMDGLALAAPVGDPNYEKLRGPLAIPKSGANAGLPLDPMFLLNGAMPYLHGLYQKREALLLHAVATPYRARSHFDGQDVLESGLSGVMGSSASGWLNRALQNLPGAGAAMPGKAQTKGLAIGAVVPLMMAGPAPVLSWSPRINALPLVEATEARLLDLYAQTDPALAKAFADGLEIDRMAGAGVGVQPTPVKIAGAGSQDMDTPPMASIKASAPPQGNAQPQRPYKEFVDTAEAAARFLAETGGPRVGMLSYNNWDTHANEGAVGGLLATRFGGLDAALQAFATGMGPAWRDTVVVVVTEFGRTARTNGTGGTDHGTATAALLLGGGVRGGRVIADWPGLSDAALYEGRDLRSTCDLRGVFKGLLRDHLGIPDAALNAKVFPDSAEVKPLQDLLA